MPLLIYFVCLFFLFNFRKALSPGLFLICIYSISLILALLIGYDYEIDSGFKAFNLIFMAVILSLFILPWNSFKYNVVITEPDPKKLQKLTVFLLIVNGLAFVFFLIACLYTYTHVIDYSAYKNDGESNNLSKQLPIDHTLFLIAIYLHPSAYFLVPIHFYYLIKKKYVISFLSFFFSLNVVLNGLTVFSRSVFVTYLFLYLLYLPFFYPKLTSQMKNLIRVAGLTIFGMAATVFYIITQNRFANVLQYNDAAGKYGSLVKSPELYSLFEYLSQWYKGGSEVLANYSSTTLNGQLSFPIFYQFIADQLKIIPYTHGSLETKLFTLMGDNFDRFTGITTNIVSDFGYLGALLFAIIYVVILRKLRPVRGKIPFAKMLMLGMMFVLPAMGIFNYEMKGIFYNLLIIYAVIVYRYLKETRKKN